MGAGESKDGRRSSRKSSKKASFKKRPEGERALPGGDDESDYADDENVSSVDAVE